MFSAEGPTVEVIEIVYLAYGKEGQVFQAKLRDTQQPVAVKCIERWEEQIVSLKKTLEFCKQLQHPNIVRHLHHQAYPSMHPLEPPVYQVIMELCQGGTLRATLRRMVITPYLLQKWTKEIVEGLSYLHENHCVHRDIKGDNILMTSRNLDTSGVKLADLSTIATTGEVSPGYGTYPFMAPEMIADRNPEIDESMPVRGSPADIWSLGCVVIEMLNGTSPQFFREHDGKKSQIKGEQAVLSFVKAGGSPTIPIGLPPDIHCFIERCLDRNPSERKSAPELKRHAFLVSPEAILTNWVLSERIGEILGPADLQEFSVGAQRIIPLEMRRMIADSWRGKVFMAQRTDTDNTVAVKSILLELDPVMRAREVNHWRANFLTAVALQHPHVVRHIHQQEAPTVSANDPPTLQILMEFCGGPTLYEAVRKFTPSYPLLQKWTTQLVDGISYLHSQQCVHRDISGDNILLSSTDFDNCLLKICGFGAIKRLEGETTQPREVSEDWTTANYLYMSPEIIIGEQQDGVLDRVPRRVGTKTDIWSLGCVVIEMVTGKRPAFYNSIGKEINTRAPEAVMFFVSQGGAPYVPEHLPVEVKNFIGQCIQHDSILRPRAIDLKRHDFLTSNEG